jgi:hypothetical protein
MGREAEGLCRWQGREGQVKALLESQEIILRGEIRARLPRAGLSDWRVDGEGLIIETPYGPLKLELGAVEAGRWVAALSKPLPGLAQKLGLSAERSGYGIGMIVVPEIEAAMQGATAPDPQSAAMLISVLRTLDDLETALTVACDWPALPVWCVHGKGRSAVVSDAMVRATFRAAGYIDTKSSAVSADWTATRYGKSN